VRTAFGEIVYIDGPVESRYGYAGGWGYETHDIDSNGAGNGTPDNTLNAPAAVGFPFMHVGARYYDPATARFLQRDPIGILGGLNVYGYAGGQPMNRVDPSGLDYCGTGIGWVDGPCAGPGPAQLLLRHIRSEHFSFMFSRLFMEKTFSMCSDDRCLSSTCCAARRLASCFCAPSGCCGESVLVNLRPR
jgi:RHS repeat-associated protein